MAGKNLPYHAFHDAIQRPASLYEDLEETACAPCLQREMAGWSSLAVLALALAGVFAALLAVSRIPGAETVVPWPIDFFSRGLVIHVVLSFVVWFLAVFGNMLYIATLHVGGGAPPYTLLGRLAWLLSFGGLGLILIPSFTNRGEPFLNNYVPVISDPLYYAGLACLGLGLALAVVRLLLCVPRRKGPLNPFAFAMVCVGVIYLLALMCVGLALHFLAGDANTHAFNEHLFWGGGHALQFLNVGLMLIGWYVLAGLSLDAEPVPDRWFRGALVWLVLAVAAMPVLYALFEPFEAGQTLAFTNLQYALAPPTVVVAALLVKTLLGAGPVDRSDPGFHCLVLSMAVFGVGGLLGLFVDGADTRTPAHYHGVIAGINLVMMGLFYRLFLPLQDRAVRVGRALYAQIWMFGLGQLFASVGLFVAGGYGTARKTAGAAQGLDAMGAKVGMVMNGIGAGIAIIGGIMFIWTIARSLLKAPGDGTTE
ncbi:MAG: cbb3-type cytochrome c oxidase subunit I [Rhodobacterales bacterium]|nr:cbb3-type cytochrome c oxidase subunit I [Rhodobacterales bacterium]